MSKIVHLRDVRCLGGHRLLLSFEDGLEGELDFSGESWDGVFAPLADPDYFARVSVDPELGTIVWPNGVDLAPETLHSWVSNGVVAVPA